MDKFYVWTVEDEKGETIVACYRDKRGMAVPLFEYDERYIEETDQLAKELATASNRTITRRSFSNTGEVKEIFPLGKEKEVPPPPIDGQKKELKPVQEPPRKVIGWQCSICDKPVDSRELPRCPHCDIPYNVTKPLPQYA